MIRASVVFFFLMCTIRKMQGRGKKMFDRVIFPPSAFSSRCRWVLFILRVQCYDSAKKTYVRDERHQEEKLPYGTFFFGILSGTFLIVHTNKKTNKITNRFIELISYNVFTKRHTNELYKKRKRIK